MIDVDVAAPGGLLASVRAVVADADEALLCVAFTNRAGVELLAPALSRAAGPVRLLATTVFGGTTEPLSTGRWPSASTSACSTSPGAPTTRSCTWLAAAPRPER